MMREFDDGTQADVLDDGLDGSDDESDGTCALDSDNGDDGDGDTIAMAELQVSGAIAALAVPGSGGAPLTAPQSPRAAKFLNPEFRCCAHKANLALRDAAKNPVPAELLKAARTFSTAIRASGPAMDAVEKFGVTIPSVGETRRTSTADLAAILVAEEKSAFKDLPGKLH